MKRWAVALIGITLLGSCELMYDSIYPDGRLVVRNDSAEVITYLEVQAVNDGWANESLLEDSIGPGEVRVIAQLQKSEMKLRIKAESGTTYPMVYLDFTKKEEIEVRIEEVVSSQAGGES